MAIKIAEFEALLYLAGDNGLATKDLCQLLGVDPPAVRELGKELQRRLKQNADSGIVCQHLGGSYKLTTSPKTSEVVEKYFHKDMAKRLSQSALEILAIVAYKQPVTRVEIDDIRGVNSQAALQTLVWRGLVKQDGNKDAPGRPRLYVTTDYFLQYFGYHSLADLPVIENFEDDSFDQEGQVDLFASKGGADKNIAGLRKERKNE